MGRVLLFALLFALIPSLLYGHLCNDVFVQAKDNLAVKVDIRDGQLRIAKEASFKVYLLNTMDRDIVNINLEVESKEFESTVTPSPEWKDFPALRTAAKGGKKEFFEVKLTRGKGVADGKYKIGLKLFNARNTAQVFKTMDIAESADIVELPKVAGIKTDGNPSSTEWKKGALVTDFYDYVRSSKGRERYYENIRCDDQPRIRLAYNGEHLHLMYSFKSTLKLQTDKVVALLSKDMDGEPIRIEFDRLEGTATNSLDSQDVKVEFNQKDGEMECQVPLKLLGIEGKKGSLLFANFMRDVSYEGKDAQGKPTRIKTMHYWRGNNFSATNPVVFARFEFE